VANRDAFAGNLRSVSALVTTIRDIMGGRFNGNLRELGMQVARVTNALNMLRADMTRAKWTFNVTLEFPVKPAPERVVIDSMGLVIQALYDPRMAAIPGVPAWAARLLGRVWRGSVSDTVAVLRCRNVVIPPDTARVTVRFEVSVSGAVVVPFVYVLSRGIKAHWARLQQGQLLGFDWNKFDFSVVRGYRINFQWNRGRTARQPWRIPGLGWALDTSRVLGPAVIPLARWENGDFV
jgi:hypothetical protein